MHVNLEENKVTYHTIYHTINGIHKFLEIFFSTFGGFQYILMRSNQKKNLNEFHQNVHKSI